MRTGDEHWDDATQIARLSREAHTRQRSEIKLNKRVVLLENAIRMHATAQCGCDNHQECLARLYKLVPTAPRRKRRKA